METKELHIHNGDRYTHRHGAHGHGADHVLPDIISPSLVRGR